MNGSPLDFWLLLAGIGIFMFGIHMLEESIKVLSGKGFKIFLRKYTSRPFKAILSGTLSTAILQSSSAVTLMVLAFAGAGIMQLSNALGVIIGSNLGTTLTSWIVATIGFKINIESLALPILGIGGLSLIFFGKSPRISNISKLAVGFGFLFMGLDYMKNSIDGLAEGFDFTTIAGYHSIAFVVIGFLLTAIVQSSSAAMAIILSVVFSGVISFDKAAAMVIGTNLGTTITIILGSMAGPTIKKQIGLSHFIFNFTTGLIAFLFLPWLIQLLSFVYPISTDPVIGLALFHTFFNLIGVILYFPFLVPFAKLIVYLISEKPDQTLPQLVKVTTEVPEAAILSLEMAYKELLFLVMRFNLHVAKIDDTLIFKDAKMEQFHIPTGTASITYQQIKLLQNQLFSFSSEVQAKELNENESLKLNKLMHSIRFAVNSAKSMKDTKDYLDEMAIAENTLVQNQFNEYRRFIMALYQVIVDLPSQWNEENLPTLLQWRKKIIEIDAKLLKEITSSASSKVINAEEVDLLLSANRGFILSSRQLVSSIRDALLSEQEIQIYDNI